MLSEVKLAKRISNTTFDPELLRLIKTGVADLENIGIEFECTPVSAGGQVVDYTIPDELASQAVLTYVLLHFGEPSNYAELKASYDEQKGQLRENSKYGMVKAWEEA